MWVVWKRQLSKWKGQVMVTVMVTMSLAPTAIIGTEANAS